MKMRRTSQGNIILTALFVSVFLFFLSVALVWMNRQDIALNLFMEHKLKAQSAARSGAMVVYSQLRETGQVADGLEGTLPNGASWKVQMVEVPANPTGVKKLLVQSRGTSGIQNSFYTLHLEATEMGTPIGSGGQGRVLLFPGSGVAGGSESSDPQPEQSRAGFRVVLGGGGLITVTMGDGETLGEQLSGNGGAIFSRRNLQSSGSPFFVVDWLPVFSLVGGDLRGVGPTLVVAPELQDETEIRQLALVGEDFQWQPVPLPLEIEDPLPVVTEDMITSLIELATPDPSRWSSITLKALEESGQAWGFRERQPPARSVEEVTDLAVVGGFDASEPRDWSEGRPTQTKQYFTTRGAITTSGNDLYSHGWHYLYRAHDGTVPAELTPLVGAKLTRWPCILAYNSQSRAWTKAWSALDNYGSVSNPQVPNPEVLVADSSGSRFYSVTTEGTPRLLTFSGGNKVEVGDVVPPGELFCYQNQIYLASTDPERPGLIGLVGGRDHNFANLLPFLPEVRGEMVETEIGEESMIHGLEGHEPGKALSAENTSWKTARPAYRFRYAIREGSRPAVDDRDVWVEITIRVEMIPPTYPLVGQPPFDVDSPYSALARFNGEYWSILPHGLRATLADRELSSPPGSSRLVVGRFSGLPQETPRYTIISVDTHPFK